MCNCLVLIYTGYKANLLKNLDSDCFEVWQDGRRIGEILTASKIAAIKTFKKLFGE